MNSGWFADLVPRTDQDRVATMLLLVANLLPVIGLFLFDWGLFTLLFIYWAESAIVGGLALISIIIVGGLTAKAVFSLGFFLVHFGMFMGGHLIFLTLIAQIAMDGFGVPIGQTIGTAFQTGAGGLILGLAFIALIASHTYEHVTATLPRIRDTEQPIKGLMGIPYSRVIVMHLTILTVLFMIAIIGTSSDSTLMVLIVLKVLGDLFAMDRNGE